MFPLSRQYLRKKWFCLCLVQYIPIFVILVIYSFFYLENTMELRVHNRLCHASFQKKSPSLATAKEDGELYPYNLNSKKCDNRVGAYVSCLREVCRSEFGGKNTWRLPEALLVSNTATGYGSKENQNSRF